MFCYFKYTPRSCPASPVPLITQALIDDGTIFVTHIFLGTPLSDTVGDSGDSCTS
jgi:hypothetical protein